MKTKPIYLKPDEIQAILDNRKSMFRCVVKRDINNNPDLWICNKHPQGFFVFSLKSDETSPLYTYIPRYPVGTLLWCAEPWRVEQCNHDSIGGYFVIVEYKCGQKNKVYVSFEDYFEKWLKAEYNWQSPAHMPKDFARIWLKVTGNKVHRLQEMYLNEYFAEGINRDMSQWKKRKSKDGKGTSTAASREFADMWDSTHAKHKWESNPWVEAVTFERVDR